MKRFLIAVLIIFIPATVLSQDNLIINFNDSSNETFNIDNILEINFIDSYIPISSIEVLDENISVRVDEQITVNYQILPENATNKNVSWSSDNTEIATVNQSGQITGIEVGETTITISNDEDGVSTTFPIKVEASLSVGLSNNDIQIYPNPTDDVLFIDIPFNSNFEVIISDLNGNLLLSEYDNSSIDISRLSAGVYFTYVIINNKYYNFQIIKN